MAHRLLLLPLLLLAAAAPAQLVVAERGNHRPIDPATHEFLSSTHAGFERAPNTWTWVSDVEHVVEKERRELAFLADGDPPLIMGDGVVPAGRDFELFPYHYYDEWEVEQLGGRVNYRLAVQNRGNETVTINLYGVGTTRQWNHGAAWAPALAGEGARTITLEPGATATLWEERALEGGLPWSGIFLGRASGDIRVVDYCHLGDEDPGFAHATAMPDLTWQPYELASFSRGHIDWNAANITWFPARRADDGSLPLSRVAQGSHSIAYGFSPGGPISNLCLYNEVPQTFARDETRVVDPVSRTNHLFFGGNYPIMYRQELNLHNDTATTQVVTYLLCSNDIFGVDSLVGVHAAGRFVHDRVRPWRANAHWPVLRAELAPGQRLREPFTVVALGGRWGGLIGTVEVQAVAANGGSVVQGD